MRQSVQLRWIAEAEARSVREMVRVQQAASEPQVCLASAEAGPPSSFDWLRRLVPKPVWAATAEPPHLVDTTKRERFGSAAPAIGSPAETDSDRVLVTVLITDIVDSTRQVAEMGDRRWQALLDRHDDATRQQIARFGGKEIRHRGDGFLATFDSPTRAVRCAAAIAERIAPLGLSVRSGIHSGEILVKRTEISGIAVHIAARIAALALPGEALVSTTVRDLVTGSGLAFEDRGTHPMRGLPGQVHLHAMRAAGSETDTGVTALEERMFA